MSRAGESKTDKRDKNVYKKESCLYFYYTKKGEWIVSRQVLDN